MKNDTFQHTQQTKLSGQLSAIISACDDYSEMQAEILNLQNSYIKADAAWAKEICKPALLLLERLKNENQKEEQKRQSQLVKAVINSLSYTELEVVLGVFEAMGKDEGVLVAGKIADNIGATRSVVVSALRKLESARIVETRSLGVKGTYIKVLNPLWLKELKKLKV